MKIIISGIISFILEKNWFSKFTYVQKIPLYSIIGVSISYAVVFAIVDLIK